MALLGLLFCWVLAPSALAAPDQPISDELYVSVMTRYITITNHASAGAADYMAHTILSASKQNNVDPLLMTSLIAQESCFKPDATSRAGAMGLGQLMPATASMLGVTDPYDVVQNIDGATRYMASLLQRFSGSTDPVSLALAAYNAGPSAVQRCGGIPQFPETVQYVYRVTANYSQIKSLLTA